MNANSPTAQPAAKPSFFSGVGCWAGLAIIVVSLFLYFIACITPAMVFDKETWLGIKVLVLGWQGILLAQFAWFANGFWLLSLLLVFLRRWFLTIGATALTVLIALDSFLFLGQQIPLDEANVNHMVFQFYHIGFYFWLASLAVVGIGAGVIWLITRKIK